MEVADTERRGEHDKIYLVVECYEKGVVQYKKVVGAGEDKPIKLPAP